MNGTVLLDVNVLIALAWPNHLHHVVARTWFDDQRSHGWATSPLTESGFVRISSNAKAIPSAVSPAEAVELLVRLRQLPGHQFWTDDVSLAASREVPLVRLVSYTQVPDAHLLALARKRGGRVATFDRGFVALAGPGHERDVMLLGRLPQQRAADLGEPAKS